jgi:hypothetical protein
MRTVVLGLAILGLSATVASASQCPLLQAQVDKEFGKRFDRQAAQARATAAEGWALHRAGKHADSVKKYEEAAKAGGLKLQMK